MTCYAQELGCNANFIAPDVEDDKCEGSKAESDEPLPESTAQEEDQGGGGGHRQLEGDGESSERVGVVSYNVQKPDCYEDRGQHGNDEPCDGVFAEIRGVEFFIGAAELIVFLAEEFSVVLFERAISGVAHILLIDLEELGVAAH